MTAKEYLNGGLHLYDVIYAKLEQIETLRNLATKTSAMLSDMPGNPNHDTSKLENMVIKIVSLEEEIYGDMTELIEKERMLMKTIETVKDPQERTVLILRYLNFLTWDEIAARLGCSVRNVHILHGRALDGIEIPDKNAIHSA